MGPQHGGGVPIWTESGMSCSRGASNAPPPCGGAGRHEEKTGLRLGRSRWAPIPPNQRSRLCRKWKRARTSLGHQPSCLNFVRANDCASNLCEQLVRTIGSSRVGVARLCAAEPSAGRHGNPLGVSTTTLLFARSRDPVLIQTRHKCRAPHAQELGGRSLVAGGFLQRVDDLQLLIGLKRG